MKPLGITLFVSLAAVCATTAFAQFGMYGSPEVLRLPPPDPAIAPYSGPATGSAYQIAPVAPAPHVSPMAAAYAPAAGDGPRPLIPAAATAEDPRIPAEPAAPRGPPLVPNGPRPEPPVGAPSLADQMFSDADAGGAAGCADCDVPNSWYSGITEGLFGPSGGGYRSPWYASAYALVMSRNEPDTLWTTYETGNNPNQIVNRIPFRWCWGGEIRVGRRFCRCCGSCCDDFVGAGVPAAWALEATYWTLDAFSGMTTVSHINSVSTPLNFGEGNVSFGGAPATDWFDNAAEHRLRRRNEFHNVEVCLVRHDFAGSYGSPWELDWSAGVRFFRFEERLIFSSLRGGGSWLNPADAAYLDDQIVNNLVGFQFGVDAAYTFGPRWRVFVTPEFGIYNNHIVNDFRLYLGDGTVATQTAYPTLSYPVHSTDDVLSFLAQVDIGLDCQFAENWSARVGYRVVVATGIGLADHQVPHFITDIPEIQDINHNAELVLHGAFLGVTYNF